MPFIPNEDGGGRWVDDNESQQQYLMGYVPGEGGGGGYSQILNPNYAPTQETLDTQARNEAALAEWYKTPEGQAQIASQPSSYKSRGFIGDFVRDVSKSPVGLAALTGVSFGALPLLASYLGAGGIGAASAGVPSVGAGLAAEGAGAGLGSFLTGAGAPGFATTGALTPAFGGATFGAPTALTGVMGGALPAAAGASGATSGIAKLAEAMGINKAAEMLGMDPSTLMKLAGGLGTAAITAAANRGSGNSAPLARTGFQGQIDPNALKYVGNNQYIKNPVVKAAAGGGIKGLGMQGMAPIEYSAGGKYLNGPGDGMSDNIKANIEGKQEARLATSEFVLPADVVSHIGNGSSEAGAKKLHAMMDRIRMARTGTKEQGKQIKAEKYLPA
jgi:hypothetical protein